MRPPVDFKPMTGRVAVVIEAHRAQTVYELEIGRAEWLLADLKRAVETARKWSGCGPGVPG
jgi:hypothetical protein